eukprot:gene24294-29511_t
MENTSTEKGIQVQVDEGTDDFPGTKKRDRKLMLRCVLEAGTCTCQGKVGEDDRGSLSTPLPSMPVQSEMPLAILHEHIVYLLLYLQDTKPQIYMGELYMGKAVDQ